MQMLGKNVLMSEEFEGPHGQSMLHSKLRKSESLKFVWTFWTKLFTPISILPALAMALPIAQIMIQLQGTVEDEDRVDEEDRALEEEEEGVGEYVW